MKSAYTLWGRKIGNFSLTAFASILDGSLVFLTLARRHAGEVRLSHQSAAVKFPGTEFEFKPMGVGFTLDILYRRVVPTEVGAVCPNQFSVATAVVAGNPIRIGQSHHDCINVVQC